MMLFLKFSVYFTISFLLLCIPINGDPLFAHLHRMVLPEVKVIFRFMGEETKKGIKKSKVVGEKFFDSRPPESSENTPAEKPESEDLIHSKKSAVKKNIYEEENYSDEERAMLKKAMKSGPDT